MKKAGELYKDATLPMGDGSQSPDDFARQQSASTGLPEHMCKANMAKNHFVLSNMDKILDSLTRGLPPSTTGRCGKPVMQSDPGRAAGPDPLAAMIKLFTRPGKFCVAASAMRPPMEWPKRCAAEIFR